jgi:RHS repeat-associated protein
VTLAGPLPAGSYGYNTRGEQTTANTQQRTFDMAGRLVRVTGLGANPHSGAEVRYEYDVHGRRVTQWRDRHPVDVRVSYYTFDGLLRGEADNYTSAQESRDYVYLGPMLIAKSFASWTGLYPRTTTYLHTDALGSTIAETNQAGAVTRRERHLSYGAPMDGVMEDTAGYTGHQQDPATGLIYMQQRYYDPSIGRFLSVDSVWPLSDPVGYFGRYHYAANNPYRYADPDGRAWGLLAKVVKVVAKGGDVAATVAGAVEDGRTLVSSNATVGQRIGAGLSLASEVFSPVSARDVKAGVSAIRGSDGVADRAGGPDFVVTPSGTAVPVSQTRMREGLDAAGFPSRPADRTSEAGIIHEVPGPSGPIDVRTMEGGSGGDRRAVFSRAGTNDPVQMDGGNFPNGTPRADRRAGSHLDQAE